MSRKVATSCGDRAPRRGSGGGRLRAFATRAPQDRRDAERPTTDTPEASSYEHRRSPARSARLRRRGADARRLRHQRSAARAGDGRRDRLLRHPAGAAGRSTSRCAATRPARRSARRCKARLASMAAERPEIPLVIGGQRITTGDTAQATIPCAHQRRAGRLASRAPGRRRARDRRGARRTSRVGELGVGGPRRGLPARRRAARHDVAPARSTPRRCSASRRRRTRRRSTRRAS